MNIGNIRLNRLKEEYRRMVELKAKTDLIDFEVVELVPNSPPEKYIIKYSCRGITGLSSDKKPIYSFDHKISIYLWAEYPRQQPYIRAKTRIWHPNIRYDSGEVCLNIWAASRTLDEICIMIGEMIQYNEYNLDSPLDHNVAEWAKNNKSLFPIDDRPLLCDDPTYAIRLKEPNIEIKLLEEDVDIKLL